VQTLCDTKQGYTQYGGLRPFGVSFLIAGWDVHHGFQLYQSDPSGNYGGWKATAIGANNQAAQSILRQVRTKHKTARCGRAWVLRLGLPCYRAGGVGRSQLGACGSVSHGVW
jgi:hypothetical protein